MAKVPRHSKGITATSEVEIKSLGVGQAAPTSAGLISCLIVESDSVIASSTVTSDGYVSGKHWVTVTPTVKTLALVSGVAYAASATGYDMTVTVQLTATTAGHASVTIGPTTGAEHVIATDLTMVAGSSTVVTVKVPGTWKIVVTVVTVEISRAIAIG